jgi:DNA polymerase III epsilon subunit-like protein
MIVVDIETSGLSAVKNGLWQIGAFDLESGEGFLQEGRIDEEDLVVEEALKIIGKTEGELRENNKQSQKELIENFFQWVSTRKVKNLICHNPPFDKSFLEIKGQKYGLKVPFPYRSFDLHTIAQMKFFEVNGKFLTKEDNNSDMGLRNILKLCGIEDPRRSVRNGDISKEGKPHNALEDARLTAECFSRLVYGKKLFEEYSNFEIPDYLKDDNLQ